MTSLSAASVASIYIMCLWLYKDESIYMFVIYDFLSFENVSLLNNLNFFKNLSNLQELVFTIDNMS